MMERGGAVVAGLVGLPSSHPFAIAATAFRNMIPSFMLANRIDSDLTGRVNLTVQWSHRATVQRSSGTE